MRPLARFARVFLVLLLVGGAACSGSAPAPENPKMLGATPDPDPDLDGLRDQADRCPDAAEDKDGYQDYDGCPDLDNDGDGIADLTDQCPNDQEDRDGFQDDDGCPDRDDDKDQILDAVDQCPREAEIYNGIDDTDGCPDKGKLVVITCAPQPIITRIEFVGATATIRPESVAVIKAAADVLAAHPEILLVEIEGHTDENGAEVANVNLSLKRAEAVVDALVKAGVDRSRLRAQGYGGYCPLDAAHTEAAWAKNRRADFKILKTDTGPTATPTGCDAATAKGLVSKPVP